jgi:putative hydrolase of the HAD superfamily
MISYVIFDFFGTLVQYSDSLTGQGYQQSYRLLLQAGADLGYEDFLRQWSAFFTEFDRKAESSGREFSMTDVAGAFLSRNLPSTPSIRFISDFADLSLSEWNKGVRYPGGIRELLERLARQFDLAIISNTHDPGLVPDHLALMGVSNLFQAVVTSVEFGVRKPNPAIFEHALQVLGVAAEDCVYVGDNFATDYVGAQAAGMRALLIDPLQEQDVPDEDRLESVFALQDILLASI